MGYVAFQAPPKRISPARTQMPPRQDPMPCAQAKCTYCGWSMPDARLQRTRDIYRAEVFYGSGTIAPIPADARLTIPPPSPFPPNREVRDGGQTPRLDALIAWLKRQAGRF